MDRNLLPIKIRGKVVYGEGLGKKYGMPTANMEYDKDVLLGLEGVFVSKVYIDDKEYIGVTNVGLKKTIVYNKQNIETNILDFSSDIYGKIITVDLLYYIRPIIKFNNLKEVKERVDKDKEYARKMISINE